MALYDTPIPGASAYAGEALKAKQAYQNAIARVSQKRQQGLQQYGYAADTGADGTLSNMRVDTGNPYGLYQQNRLQHAQQDEQATYAAQERGLGTGGGLAAQQHQQLRFGFGQQDSQLGQGLVGLVGDSQDALNQAGYDYHGALWNAEHAAAQAAINNGDFNPADQSDTQYPTYSDPVTDPPPVVTNDGGRASATARKVLAARTKARSVAAVKNGQLGRYGLGAAGTYAKGKAPARRPSTIPAASYATAAHSRKRK